MYQNRAVGTCLRGWAEDGVTVRREALRPVGQLADLSVLQARESVEELVHKRLYTAVGNTNGRKTSAVENLRGRKTSAVGNTKGRKTSAVGKHQR